MITMGGDAELEQVDSLDPFEGIIFSVRPPKKSWKNISNLSGVDHFVTLSREKGKKRAGSRDLVI